MRYRRLTGNGPEISVVGMGCWGIGGPTPEWGWSDLNDELSLETMRTAVDLGINWFDTAPTYGLGHAEELVGRALGPLRDQVVIATKFGRTWDRAGRLGRCGSYEWIVKECEASLRRLDTDYIDLYQMHWPDPKVPVEESMRAAVDLVTAGKVRYIGVCNFDVNLLDRGRTVCDLASHQLPYSILHRGPETELLAYGVDHALPVLAYSPLESGLLSGSLQRGQSFAPGDWRAEDDRFRGERLNSFLEVGERLSAVADREGITLPQLAVSWVLRAEPVVSTIVGGRRPEHIAELARASDISLQPDALAAIETIVGAEVGM